MKNDRLQKGHKVGMVFLQCLLVTLFLIPLPHLVAKSNGQEIPVGQVKDLTGPACEVGKPFADGYKDGIDYVNKSGGINGRKIKLYATDCAYNLPREVAAFQKFTLKNIVSIMTWSSGGTLQIGNMCVKKKIVHFLASPSGAIIAPERTYTFLSYSSYLDQELAAVRYERDKYKDLGGKLKAAIITADNPHGKMMKDAMRKMCKDLGIQLVAEEIVGFKDVNATTQMLNIKRKNPHFVITNEVEPANAVILRDAAKVGIDTKKMQFYLTVGGIGQALLKLAGKNVENAKGMSCVSDWTESNLPGVQRIRQFKEENNKKPLPFWYVMGWSNAQVLAEGLKRVGNKEITGENLKKALETLKDFDTGGLCAPITFTSTKHKGSNGVKLFKPNLQENQWTAASKWIYH